MVFLLDHFRKRTYVNSSDEQLVEMVQKGDSSSLTELHARYANLMHRFFYAQLGGDNERASDFTQELFLKIIQKAYTIDTQKLFKTWIYTVARNMIKNEYRRQAVRRNETQATDLNGCSKASQQPLPCDQADLNAFQQGLKIALSKLPSEKREVFCLRHLDQLSLAEISEQLNISKGTVKSRLHYASQYIKSELAHFNQ